MLPYAPGPVNEAAVELQKAPQKLISDLVKNEEEILKTCYEMLADLLFFIAADAVDKRAEYQVECLHDAVCHNNDTAYAVLELIKRVYGIFK